MGKIRRDSQIDSFVHGIVALLFQGHSIYYAGFQKREYTTNNCYQLLQNENVLNRKDLEKACISLVNEGQRATFNRIWYAFRSYNKQDRMDIIKNTSMDEPEFPYIKIAHEYMHNIPKGGILAMDVARYLSITLAGKKVGYLGKQEAKDQYIIGIRNLQKSYSSWEDFLTGYFLGEKIISINLGEVYQKASKKYVHRLFTSPHSFMNRADWNIDLDLV